MLKEIVEKQEDPAIVDLNKMIDKMIKDGNKKGLDILSKELDKILKKLK